MIPNLFIIGAPKCGTSSLFNWLSGHPEICGSNKKELFFLTDPNNPLSRRPNLPTDGVQAYATQFPAEAIQHRYCMEGTTHYLFDPKARDFIAKQADAKVIVVLREPAMRVYSSFQYTANNLARVKRNLSFENYVTLVRSGESLWPKWCAHRGSAYVLDRDLDYSRYINHVSPWMKSIDCKRFKIIIMEDMIRDPKTVVDEALQWLQLSPLQEVTDFSKRFNRTREIRWHAVQRLVNILNKGLSVPEPLRQSAKSVYSALQFRKRRNISASDSNAIALLQKEYRRSVEELEKLAAMDFREWKMH